MLQAIFIDILDTLNIISTSVYKNEIGTSVRDTVTELVGLFTKLSVTRYTLHRRAPLCHCNEDMVFLYCTLLPHDTLEHH